MGGPSVELFLEIIHLAQRSDGQSSSLTHPGAHTMSKLPTLSQPNRLFKRGTSTIWAV
jgi:hypothetical protein